MKRLVKSQFNEDLDEYVKNKVTPTNLERILLNIDKKRAVDLIIKNFNGEGEAFFGKTDDVLNQVKTFLQAEDDFDSYFEDWEKDSVLSMPYLLIELKNNDIYRVEGYYFDDVVDMLSDTEQYLNAAAISDSVQI